MSTEAIKETIAGALYYYVADINTGVGVAVSPEFDSAKDAQIWLRDNYRDNLRVCEARFYS